MMIWHGDSRFIIVKFGVSTKQAIVYFREFPASNLQLSSRRLRTKATSRTKELKKSAGRFKRFLMQAGRTSAQIKAEIECLFGFFPSLFRPVLGMPETLESLWQETLAAYVNNPLPALFKEKLFARLSRYCVAPYCVVTHSCLMRSLGQCAGEILRVLEQPALTSDADIEGPLRALAAAPAPLLGWPEPGSQLEEALLGCAEISFLNARGAAVCRAELRRALGPANYANLIRFLSYIKLAHLWVESYPEISYQADQRTMEMLATIARDTPRLANFFSHYPEIVRRETESCEQRLSAELADLKRIEEALRVSEERYRTLVESAPEAILVVDMDTGRFVDANENSVRLFGFEKEKLFKLGPVDISRPIAPDGSPSGELASEKLREALSGGAPVFEWVHRNSAGEDVHCEVRLMRLPGAERHLVRGSVTDITARKQAEVALRQYVERLRAMREMDRSILAAKTAEEIASVALRRLRDLVPSERVTVTLKGPTPDEATVLAADVDGERTVEAGERLPIELYGSLSSLIAERLQQGETYLLDVLSVPNPAPTLREVWAKGRRYYFIVPLLAGDELMGSLSLGTDCVSELTTEHLEIARGIADGLAIAVRQARLHEQIGRHAAELEQRVAERTAELEAFSYSVSHDLRTPLLTIDGFSRMLLEDHTDGLDAEGRRLLETICRSSQNMGRLIDDLLAFSRLGRQEMRPAEVRMSILARMMYEELRASEPERKLQFDLQPLPTAHGDQSMIRQVWGNLLANAIKFTGPREIAVIEVGAAEEENQNVYYVRDNGVGFEMKYADKLFGVFQRLHSDEEFAGTGVGLAFVQRIIHRHGGRVWAEGKVGEGATVYFTLPRKGRNSW
jgi:PAS domain S-box-containing protein